MISLKNFVDLRFLMIDMGFCATSRMRSRPSRQWGMPIVCRLIGLPLHDCQSFRNRIDSSGKSNTQPVLL